MERINFEIFNRGTALLERLTAPEQETTESKEVQCVYVSEKLRQIRDLLTTPDAVETLDCQSFILQNFAIELFILLQATLAASGRENLSLDDLIAAFEGEERISVYNITRTIVLHIQENEAILYIQEALVSRDVKGDLLSKYVQNLEALGMYLGISRGSYGKTREFHIALAKQLNELRTIGSFPRRIVYEIPNEIQERYHVEGRLFALHLLMLSKQGVFIGFMSLHFQRLAFAAALGRDEIEGTHYALSVTHSHFHNTLQEPLALAIFSLQAQSPSIPFIECSTKMMDAVLLLQYLTPDVSFRLLRYATMAATRFTGEENPFELSGSYATLVLEIACEVYGIDRNHLTQDALATKAGIGNFNQESSLESILLNDFIYKFIHNQFSEMQYIIAMRKLYELVERYGTNPDEYLTPATYEKGVFSAGDLLHHLTATPRMAVQHLVTYCSGELGEVFELIPPSTSEDEHKQRSVRDSIPSPFVCLYRLILEEGPQVLSRIPTDTLQASSFCKYTQGVYNLWMVSQIVELAHQVIVYGKSAPRPNPYPRSPAFILGPELEELPRDEALRRIAQAQEIFQELFVHMGKDYLTSHSITSDGSLTERAVRKTADSMEHFPQALSDAILKSLLEQIGDQHTPTPQEREGFRKYCEFVYLEDTTGYKHTCPSSQHYTLLVETLGGEEKEVKHGSSASPSFGQYDTILDIALHKLGMPDTAETRSLAQDVYRHILHIMYQIIDRTDAIQRIPELVATQISAFYIIGEHQAYWLLQEALFQEVLERERDGRRLDIFRVQSVEKQQQIFRTIRENIRSTEVDPIYENLQREITETFSPELVAQVPTLYVSALRIQEVAQSFSASIERSYIHIPEPSVVRVYQAFAPLFPGWPQEPILTISRTLMALEPDVTLISEVYLRAKQAYQQLSDIKTSTQSSSATKDYSDQPQHLTEDSDTGNSLLLRIVQVMDHIQREIALPQQFATFYTPSNVEPLLAQCSLIAHTYNTISSELPLMLQDRIEDSLERTEMVAEAWIQALEFADAETLSLSSIGTITQRLREKELDRVQAHPLFSPIRTLIEKYNEQIVFDLIAILVPQRFIQLMKQKMQDMTLLDILLCRQHQITIDWSQPASVINDLQALQIRIETVRQAQGAEAEFERQQELEKIAREEKERAEALRRAEEELAAQEAQRNKKKPREKRKTRLAKERKRSGLLVEPTGQRTNWSDEEG
jgi:hypothetical protein